MIDESKNQDKNKRTKKEIKKRERRRWVFLVTIGSFLSTMLISYISDALLASASLAVSVIILLLIILVGVFSDIIGIAVASASLDHFNAMASRKVPGAKISVSMVKNAARVSNICNDVIGDICGIVSGATSVVIVAQLTAFFSIKDSVIAGLIMSGAVAALTIGGKALGKEIAINNSTQIIQTIAGPVAALKRLFTGTE